MSSMPGGKYGRLLEVLGRLADCVYRQSICKSVRRDRGSMRTSGGARGRSDEMVVLTGMDVDRMVGRYARPETKRRRVVL